MHPKWFKRPRPGAEAASSGEGDAEALGEGRELQGAFHHRSPGLRTFGAGGWEVSPYPTLGLGWFLHFDVTATSHWLRDGPSGGVSSRL